MSEMPAKGRAASHPARLRLFADTTATVGDEASEHPPRIALHGARPKLWFAILTYNALPYTKRCLASLDLHTDEPWHAVILDNGSVDGSREWLAALNDPRVSVELGAENRGVAGGRNRLLELIGDRAPDDGFVVFIDNDLEFFAGWLSPFRALFARAPRAGMASCVGFEMVVHAERRELISYPGLIPMPVDVASGGFACFVKPAVFRAVGGFDEFLNPFWHEDDDISVRVRLAGWDVWAIPNASVVHHGHKSGHAIDASSFTRSREKQSYLVRKWRELGIVGADGALRYGAHDAPDPIAVALAARMHRASPLRRSEVERARLDVSQLAHTLHELGALRVRTRYASAPALALLAERVQHAAATRSADAAVDATATTLHRAVSALLETRRRQSRLPMREPSLVNDGANKLADVADWQDDTFFAAAVNFAEDGRGRHQWYDRNVDTWQCAQMALVLERVDLLRNNRHLLVLGDVRRPMVWALAERVAHVTVGDFIERHGAAPGDASLHCLARFALRAVPVDRVRVVDIGALSTNTAPTSAGAEVEAFAHLHADGAVLLPWVDDLSVDAMPISEMGGMLQLAAHHLVPGGILVVTVPVRLAGPPDVRVLENVARLSPWLTSLGLEVVGPVVSDMSDEGLLAATDHDLPLSRTPDVLVADGARLIGYLCFACRRVGAT